MTDPETPGASADGATAEQATAGWVPPTDAPASTQASADQRPELAVGAAFAGGLLAALILKRLAR